MGHSIGNYSPHDGPLLASFGWNLLGTSPVYLLGLFPALVLRERNIRFLLSLTIDVPRVDMVRLVVGSSLDLHLDLGWL